MSYHLFLSLLQKIAKIVDFKCLIVVRDCRIIKCDFLPVDCEVKVNEAPSKDEAEERSEVFHEDS